MRTRNWHEGYSRPLCLLLLLSPGCHENPAWDGTVLQWGTMREALAEGQTQARVSLAETVVRPRAYGVGALEHLTGEVTIVDGQVWLAKSDGALCATGVSNDDGVSAALLAVAYVPTWHPVEITSEVGPSDLEAFIRQAASKHHLPVGEPFPFRITGRLDVDAHVINGSCPHAGGTTPGLKPPYRFTARDRHGQIMGFFAENAAGSLTHHGESSHMHVLFDSEPLFTGHVDRLRVHPGATLYVPE